ncbi:isocitrate lyase/PEP mutase family protein [Alphaproteobacteria bacterium]|nr:isocitrate lyase/PEP mutase family protein [Alphaproteobacteria bacterium]MDB4857642.1 isocitrate lyase/PEP mutase family protein [Alphaproteobacteria bacterium]
MNKMAETLRQKIALGKFLPMPSCFDGLSAKMIEQEGFDLSFMSGFAASASRIGAPDLGLMSYGEVLDQARNVTEASTIPVIVDGDTGYGNAMNVYRTVSGFARVGCAGVLIEDQLSPKRCGHTPGKDVVGREEAFDRIQAAVDASREDTDIVIMGRTDANHTHGLSEAIYRGQRYHELGAEIIFIEAPKSIDEMRTLCREVPGCKLANIVEGGLTPDLPMGALEEIGYQMAVYPLTLLAASMQAMKLALVHIKTDTRQNAGLMDFSELRHRIGFDDYYETSSRYETSYRK